MPENNKYSQYTQGMTETQAAEFVRMAEIYDNRFQGRAPTPGMARLDADDFLRWEGSLMSFYQTT